MLHYNKIIKLRNRKNSQKKKLNPNKVNKKFWLNLLHVNESHDLFKPKEQ